MAAVNSEENYKSDQLAYFEILTGLYLTRLDLPGSVMVQ
jgi:hypothetical protein